MAGHLHRSTTQSARERHFDAINGSVPQRLYSDASAVHADWVAALNENG